MSPLIPMGIEQDSRGERTVRVAWRGGLHRPSTAMKPYGASDGALWSP
jgi:hypothetical protein